MVWCNATTSGSASHLLTDIRLSNANLWPLFSSPSLMLGCLVTSHSRKSAKCRQKDSLLPVISSLGGVWLAIPIPYSDSFQRETYRPIYIFIIPLSFYWFWFVVEPPSKKMRVTWDDGPIFTESRIIANMFHTPKTTLKPWALSPMPIIGTCKRTENTLWNLTWLLKIAIYSESSHYCHWWIFP